MSQKAIHKPPMVITLTMPDSDDDDGSGTLLVQRGDLARLFQFTYTRVADLTDVLADSLLAFAAVEANPPVIMEVPTPTSAPIGTKKSSQSALPSEPTVDIPLKKGKKTVKIIHLKLVGGETDAAAYRQAVQLAAILIDGKLWDGETPIRIDDVYVLAKKMKHLTAKDMLLFSLTDFVQVGATELDDAPDETDEITNFDEDDEISVNVADTPPLMTVPSINGHHHSNGVSNQTALL